VVVQVIPAQCQPIHALAQHVDHAMFDEQRAARVAMQRAAASIRPSLRSVALSNMTPPSDVMLPPSNRPSTTRRPSRPNSISLVPISSVQFDIGSPMLCLASDTNDNAPSGETADPYRLNIKARLCWGTRLR